MLVQNLRGDTRIQAQDCISMHCSPAASQGLAKNCIVLHSMCASLPLFNGVSVHVLRRAAAVARHALSACAGRPDSR